MILPFMSFGGFKFSFSSSWAYTFSTGFPVDFSSFTVAFISSYLASSLLFNNRLSIGVIGDTTMMSSVFCLTNSLPLFLIVIFGSTDISALIFSLFLKTWKLVYLPLALVLLWSCWLSSDIEDCFYVEFVLLSLYVALWLLVL